MNGDDIELPDASTCVIVYVRLALAYGGIKLFVFRVTASSGYLAGFVSTQECIQPETQT